MAITARMARSSTPRSPRRPSRLARALAGAAGLAALVALGAYHFVVYVQQPERPHALTVLDRAFNGAVAATMVASALVLGLRILTLLQLRARFTQGEAIGLAGGLGLAALSLATLGLGLASLYYAPVLVALVIAPLLLFGAERRALLDLARAAITGWGRNRGWPLLASFDAVARLAAGAVAALALFFTLIRDLTMPSLHTGYDTYQYHWAVPVLLLRSHDMRAFPGWAHANLPFGTEMLSLIALSLQAPYAALLMLDTFLLLGALTLFALVHRHFGATAAWFAVASLVTVPLLVVYTSQAMVEPALVYYGIAAPAVLVAWLRGAVDDGALDWRMAALAGLLAGAAISVKYMGAYYLPAWLAVLLLGAAAAGFPSRPAGVTPGAVWRRATVTLAAFGVGVLATYGPWALKNWLLLGNPVYPALASVFGGPLWNSARDRTLVSTFASFGPTAGKVAQWHLFAVDVFFHPWRYGEGDHFAAGLVVFFAPLGILFAWLAVRRGWLRRPGRQRDRALLFGVLMLAILATAALWTLSGALVERYALPFVVLANVLGAMLLAWALERAPRPLRPARWVALALLLGLCGYQAWISLVDVTYTDSSQRSPVALLLGQVSETRQLRGRPGPANQPPEFWQMNDYVNHTLPRSARVLLLGRGTGYFITGRDYVADSGGDWVPYLVTTGRTSDGMLAELRRWGFRYVIYDAGVMRWLTVIYHNQELARDLPAYLAFQQSRLTRVAGWGDLTIFKIPELASDRPGATTKFSTHLLGIAQRRLEVQ